jgi:hypothetical protein
MVMVYSVRVTDPAKVDTVVAPHKRTLEGAKLLDAPVIWESGEDVDPSHIDHQGRYIPPVKKDA